MKKMIMYFFMGILAVNTAVANRQDNNVTKAATILGLGWTSLGLASFGTNLQLKFRALREAEHPQYAQKLLKSARISRGIGCIGIAPFVSFLTGYSIFRIGFNLRNNTIENVGTVAMIPVLGMVILPAEKYAAYQVKKELRKKK
jgi:hypothetical protein